MGGDEYQRVRVEDEEDQAFLHKPLQDVPLEQDEKKSRAREALKKWSRLALEITMVITIIGLWFRPEIESKVIKSKFSSPIPELPKKGIRFAEDHKYLNDGMFDSKEATIHTLHQWLELSSEGRGYVHVDNPEFYDLGEPYFLQQNATYYDPVYMISGFHQLHCLSYLAQHYRSSMDEEDVTHHSVHCFDYLRQSIMCNADSNLEGKTEEGVGWGSKHTCRDWDALKKYADDHTTWKWRNGIMPGEAVL